MVKMIKIINIKISMIKIGMEMMKIQFEKRPTMPQTLNKQIDKLS